MVESAERVTLEALDRFERRLADIQRALDVVEQIMRTGDRSKVSEAKQLRIVARAR